MKEILKEHTGVLIYLVLTVNGTLIQAPAEAVEKPDESRHQSPVDDSRGGGAAGAGGVGGTLAAGATAAVTALTQMAA